MQFVNRTVVLKRPIWTLKNKSIFFKSLRQLCNLRILLLCNLLECYNLNIVYKIKVKKVVTDNFYFCTCNSFKLWKWCTIFKYRFIGL